MSGGTTSAGENEKPQQGSHTESLDSHSTLGGVQTKESVEFTVCDTAVAGLQPKPCCSPSTLKLWRPKLESELDPA